MEEIERVQYQATLAITGAYKGLSRVKLYEELGWESLSERRRSRRILQIHKMQDNIAPSYLKDKLTPHRRTHADNSQNFFCDYRCRTDRYMMSFFPDAISSWNIFIGHFATIPTYNVLKTHLLALFVPKREVFLISMTLQELAFYSSFVWA